MNGIHVVAHHTANQVQNLGLAALSETPVFDGRDSFYSLINRRFRIMLGIMLSYQGELLKIFRQIIRKIVQLQTVTKHCCENSKLDRKKKWRSLFNAIAESLRTFSMKLAKIIDVRAFAFRAKNNCRKEKCELLEKMSQSLSNKNVMKTLSIILISMNFAVSQRLNLGSGNEKTLI